MIDRERVARIKAIMRSRTRITAARVWIDRDEFGGIERHVARLIDDVREGVAVDVADSAIADLVLLGVLDAIATSSKKRSRARLTR